MSTTIDSLQIEIQTNSTSASVGIRDLAKSLSELKSSGTIGVATKNLKNLSDALAAFKDASNATRSIGKLSGAMERLKSVGSVANVANSIKKLSDNLRSIGNMSVGNIAPQIERVATALAPLSAVKAGGINTMMNGLKKLGDVTKSLDDRTIAAFAERIQKLNDALGPLSQKMTTIQTGLKGVNTKARTASSGVKELGSEVNATTLNMASMITVMQGVVAALQPVIRMLTQTISAAIEWDGIAARFGRGFGEQADETYAWIQRLNEEMGINVQQFMQYSSVYATMLTGFGVAMEDAGKMALGYTELTYDIWAGYNDVYAGFADAAEAVKSAIAGEVEPIRRAGFTIVESTLEQTAANHGLNISLEKATEAQKSYLRYLTLVDQAHSQGLVGTYAKELETAEGLMRTLSQQVKSLAQAFGSLFLPILTKVIPYVQAFVELLTEAVHWVARLFGIKIQKVDWSGYGDGVGGVADSANDATDALGSAAKAAKDLKNATLGIDELNVISPPKESGGGGGVGGGGAGFDGLGVDSLWDESIFKEIGTKVDEIKEKFKDWLGVTDGIDSWADFFQSRLGKILTAVTLVGTALAGWRIYNLLKDLKVFSAVSAVGTWLSGVIVWIKQYIAAAKQMAPFVGWFAALFPKLATAIKSISFKGILSGLGKVASKYGWVGAIIAGVIAAIMYAIEHWESVVNIFKSYMDNVIAPKIQELKVLFGELKDALVGSIPESWVEWIKNAFKTIGDAIAWAWDKFGGSVFHTTMAGVMGIFSSLISTVKGVIKIITGAVQVVTGTIETIIRAVIAIFNGNWEAVLEPLQRIWTGIKNIFAGIYHAVVGPVVELVKGVIAWFTEMWDELVGHSIVPDTVNAIVSWFTSLPSKIFGSIQKFVDGVVSKFKGMWSSLSSWWSKKTELKAYTPSIGSIYEKVKERWDSARTWWNEKKSAMKQYTPSIGSIYEKVYDRWKNARDWWNSKKGSMSYTPSIGSITDKLKSAWNSAKSWWNKNVKLSTKLNIQVPTIKVKWDTATAFGKSFKYPTGFSLKFAAGGGIFDAGSLIWAGERGAEVVANAGGGKTGVMNVQQMQDAVYEGVYAAVVAAMRASGGSGQQGVNVYLDGRQITATVEQRQRERGASIMGTQVYSY